MISLLIKRDPANAHATARELYAAEPQNPVFAFTYVFPLHLQGRTKEAIAEMDKLGLERLDDPSLALYYGVILAAEGQPETAKPHL